MTTEKVIMSFLDGATKGKASSIKIDGDVLLNYHTAIAQRINGVVVLNITKYSPTTSVHQNKLKNMLYNAKMIDNVPEDTADLSKYL